MKHETDKYPGWLNADGKSASYSNDMVYDPKETHDKKARNKMTREELRELRDGIIQKLDYLSGIRLIGNGTYREGFEVAIEEMDFRIKEHFTECEKAVFPESDTDAPPSLIAKREFLALPMDERRRILKEQADKLAGYYECNVNFWGIGGGDFGSFEALRYKKDAEVNEQGDSNA